MRPEDPGIGALLNSIPDAVVVVEAGSGRIVLCNQIAENLFGYSGQDAARHFIDDLLPPELKGPQRAKLAEYAVTGREECLEPGVAVELTAARNNGDPFWAECTFSPLEGTELEQRFVVAMFRDVSERRAMERRLEELTRTDALTGIANRRRFDLALSREWRRANRDETALSLIMIDIDHFKEYNDTYGHVAGDGCLKTIAVALAGGVRRPDDVLARYGGDEFAVILYGTPLDPASAIAEQLRSAVGAQQIPGPATGRFPFMTVSAGVASAVPVSGSKPGDLINAADRALYEAKSQGRNRVVTGSS